MQVGPAHSVAKSGCAHSAGVTSYAESPQGTPPSDEGLGSEICGIAGRIEHKEENMATDLRVTLEDRPGTLADMGEALGKAGVNIDAMCGFTCGGEGVIHLLVANGMLARRALEEAGIMVSDEREVLLYDAEDRPGMLGEVARRLAKAGVNLDLLYKASQTRLVIGADDLEKARAAL